MPSPITAPTVAPLQLSAVDLVERMAAVDV